MRLVTPLCIHCGKPLLVEPHKKGRPRAYHGECAIAGAAARDKARKRAAAEARRVARVRR